MAFLYDTLERTFGTILLKRTEVPNFIADNLKYEVRPYQTESFQRFILCYNEDFEAKPNKPFHLLYNMATGSGKTLVMAGLILYLYQKGYRNFLFFVNSNNIITKTKDNFLNPEASKYLFQNKIVIDGKTILIKDVDNFDEADNENINIHFTTIHKLHSDLNNTKENSVTYEDFQKKKMVLLADEAHHFSADTKSKQKIIEEFKPTWENTVDKILQQNFDNILLEFTATLDYETKEITEKYQDKVIQKYDLAQFRIDKYSKEINLIRSLYEEKERIIQALVLNLYRQELATSKNINLKPVILFKAKQTIKESEQNKLNFHQLIDDFSAKMVENIQKTSTVDIVQKAFSFFKTQDLTATEIAKRIQSNFKQENCISANNDKEAEKNQILLNTLEDENNPIRAVFAVQKLNEGWDVLNLFDIVRLYEGQNTGGSNKTVGKTTLSEAQLIGRGARYFPFRLETDQDLYKRKYDDDPSNDLKVLEELYYHSRDEKKYISELKLALQKQGSLDDNADNLITKQLTLKLDFKETDFYKTGKVIFNKRIPKSYNNVKSISDLGVSKRNVDFILSSGIGIKSIVFGKEENKVKQETIVPKDIKISDIPNQIIRYALTQNPFYYYANLERYFPNIESLSNFINNKDYLGGLEITFNGTETRISEISNEDYLMGVKFLLKSIEIEIKSNLTEYEGSAYFDKPIHEIFVDKPIQVYKDNERADGQEDLVANEPWYVYNANYGTSEEKAFVKMFKKRFKNLEKSFENIYLIRNEREIKIIDKLGRAFEPDFVLFCKQKLGKEMIYQVFIEPKGNGFIPKDRWKEDFLKEIRADKKTMEIQSDKYLITGVPFYNNDNENEFKEALERTLNEANA